MKKLTEKQMEDFRKEYDKAMKLPVNKFAQALAEIVGKGLSIALSEKLKKK